MEHVPVMLKEVLEGMELTPGARVIDGTVGLGGHAGAILEATSPDGTLIAFDRDARNLGLAKENLAKYGDRVTFVHDSFGNAEQYVEGGVNAILLDLGFSSLHVDDPERGFSFMTEGPLDMRYDTRQSFTAEELVNSWTKDELATLFRRYGDEPRAHQAAKAIFDARRKQRITTTTELAEVIESVIRRRGRIHPATRIFQAIRIAVNDELGEVEKILKSIERILRPGGRVAIITFHSLEDRLVKQFFKESEILEPVQKKPLKPSREEVMTNSRARSAKLRVAVKV